VASVVALAGIVAALLLTLGGRDEQPVQAAVVTQAAQPTVTVIRERTTTTRSDSTRRRRAISGSSSARSSFTPPTSSPRNRSSTLTDTSLRAAAENAVRRHWRLIESGSYDAAFDLLASSATSASRSTWVSEHVQDDLTSADLSVSATLTSPTTARVNVLRLRTVANSGCFTWTGSYDVAKIGGPWRISKANLERSDSGC
jgi:hypothetical protein